MIYFTSDLHLGHANIINHCKRPFSSVDEMDERLISMWNARVQPNDTVYVLGDLIFRSAAAPESYLSRLRGKKHLILGNHDSAWTKKADMPLHFLSVERFTEISDGRHKITLCHYPLMSWNQMAKGSYMIHGHVHNNCEATYFSLMKTMPNLLNAGVEINEYRPVTFDELVKNNERFKSGHEEMETVDDHVQGFAVFAAKLHDMTQQALYQFTPITEDIIGGKISNEKEIERHLTFMLDFCHDDAVFLLFDRIIHSIRDQHPETADFYYRSYEDMWGSGENEMDYENE